MSSLVNYPFPGSTDVDLSNEKEGDWKLCAAYGTGAVTDSEDEHHPDDNVTFNKESTGLLVHSPEPPEVPNSPEPEIPATRELESNGLSMSRDEEEEKNDSSTSKISYTSWKDEFPLSPQTRVLPDILVRIFYGPGIP
eukprot:TRINITY_DN6849_c1_g1_i4.p1 TRINITY_DN6849_c1_g1~~TRINITY_DN6849_c1_g1_i4.p1  ORF type:complete len:138 (-),score=29.86 TRINITY_DN6849_c1_g1_i4:521-934(-)